MRHWHPNHPGYADAGLADITYHFEDLEILPGVYAEGRAEISTESCDGLSEWFVEKITFTNGRDTKVLRKPPHWNGRHYPTPDEAMFAWLEEQLRKTCGMNIREECAEAARDMMGA